MSQSNKSLIDELHRRIGRNLLRFQEIELSLKLMLSYIHPNGGAKGAEAMREYQTKNIEGKSLGLLVEQFKSAISGTTELWESGLAALLEARNELVHHFYHRFDFVQPDSVATRSNIWTTSTGRRRSGGRYFECNRSCCC